MASASMSGSDQGDEEASQCSAALEELSTRDRMTTPELRFDAKDAPKTTRKIGVTKMGVADRKHVIESILCDDTQEANERFLRKLRARLERVGIDLPKIEVRYHHLSIEAEAYLRNIATPSLPNFFRSVLEWPFRVLGVTDKVKVDILSDISGILKPTRLTLLLGPPASGRTTFLRTLAGRLGSDLRVSGEITYNGQHMSEFVPLKTSAYISQHDLQTAELTVRENLDFYRRVQGVGHRYEMLTELERRENPQESSPKLTSIFS